MVSPEIYSKILLVAPSEISREAPSEIILEIIASEVPYGIFLGLCLIFLLALQGIPSEISPGVSEILQELFPKFHLRFFQEFFLRLS